MVDVSIEISLEMFKKTEFLKYFMIMARDYVLGLIRDFLDINSKISLKSDNLSALPPTSRDLECGCLRQLAGVPWFDSDL